MATSIPTFGFLTQLLDINFPENNLPWYWWYGIQIPYNFCYLAPPTWGNGWERIQFEPIIKILPIDTQPLVPQQPLGDDPLTSAVVNADPNSFVGRFNFTDQLFWKVIGLKPPALVNGTLIDPMTAPAKTLSAAVKQFQTLWNQTAANFNSAAALGVGRPNPDGGGVAYPFPITEFKVPLPNTFDLHNNQTVEEVAQKTAAGEYYLGPVPGGFWFQEGEILISKQAYSFDINIGQLDPKVWDMSVFPPVKWNGRTPKKGAYGGYGDVDFPLSGPQIV